MATKESNDKPEESTEIAQGARRRKPAVRRVAAQGEVIPAKKKAVARKAEAMEVTAGEAETVMSVELLAWVPEEQEAPLSGSPFLMPAENVRGDEGASAGSDLMGDRVPTDYAAAAIACFLSREDFSEFQAEKEVEAAMLEAELAMREDESGWMFGKAIGEIEMVRGASRVRRGEDQEFIAME